MGILLETSHCEGSCWCTHLLLKGGHARHKKEGGEFNGALHIEVGLRQGLKELLESGGEECVVLLLTYLHSASVLSVVDPWNPRHSKCNDIQRSHQLRLASTPMLLSTPV